MPIALEAAVIAELALSIVLGVVIELGVDIEDGVVSAGTGFLQPANAKVAATRAMPSDRVVRVVMNVLQGGACHRHLVCPRLGRHPMADGPCATQNARRPMDGQTFRRWQWR